MIGKRIIMPASLQGKVLSQLHINNVVIQKTRLLACKSIYWINIYVYIEDSENCKIAQATQPKAKQYYTKYQEGHGNMLDLTSLPLITCTIFAL